MTGLERVLRPEMMDRLDVDEVQLERSLADLRAANRWFGGTRLVLRLLRPILARVHERPVRILDVATGSADIPLAITDWADRAGERVRVTATDLHPATLRAAGTLAAGAGEVDVVPADARQLPFADAAFHIAICATALHHFDRAEAVRVLRELARVAASGVVVSDLRRSRTSLLGVHLLAATAWRRHPITRHDAPVSVRASFTPDELRELARCAGLDSARVATHSLFRLSLVIDRTGDRA